MDLKKESAGLKTTGPNINDCYIKTLYLFGMLLFTASFKKWVGRLKNCQPLPKLTAI